MILHYEIKIHVFKYKYGQKISCTLYESTRRTVLNLKVPYKLCDSNLKRQCTNIFYILTQPEVVIINIILPLPTRIEIPTHNAGQGFIMISYEHDKMIDMVLDALRGKGDENYADLLHLLNYSMCIF